MYYLFSVYFVSQLLYVSGISVAHHQEVYCINTTICTCCDFQLTVCWQANRQSTENHNTYKLLYLYSIPPDDGLHVEADWRNKPRINSASRWFLLHRCIGMHGQRNINGNAREMCANWKQSTVFNNYISWTTALFPAHLLVTRAWQTK